MDFSQQSAEDVIMFEGSEQGSDSEPEQDEETLNPRLLEAVEGIEDMVTSFLSQLSTLGRGSHTQQDDSDMTGDSGSEVIDRPRTHKIKSKLELRLFDRTRANSTGPPAFRYLKYPKKCPKGSVRPLAQLLRVLDLTHEALINNVPATKRDIYYNDVSLFRSQRTVDSLVDDLAATLELERSDLNIRATSKGLICGSALVLHLHTGDVVQVTDTEGTLIPVGEDIKSFSVDPDVGWVLIVEKEAIFQTLCRLKFASHSSLPGRGLIITGKGYPDIATRHLVKTLADAFSPRIPVLVMVDGDPYGIDILSVYKYGSQSLRHENTKLAAKRLEWIGLCSSELEAFGVDRDSLLPITKHDEMKALSMLRRPAATMPQEWRKELMHMLHCRRKAEIEILSTSIKLGALSRTRTNAQNDNPFADFSFDADFAGHCADTTPRSTPSGIGYPFPPFQSPMELSPYPSPLTSPLSSPPSLHSPCLAPSHAPLMQYLLHKITESVFAARRIGANHTE